MKRIVFPVHFGDDGGALHWAAGVIDLETEKVSLLDSAASEDNRKRFMKVR